MANNSKFIKIIKGSYGILKQMPTVITDLCITVYIGNQFTTYFFTGNKEEEVLRTKQIWNPITNSEDVERKDIIIQDRNAFFQHE